MSNCEIELGWSSSKECIILIIPRIPENPDANPPVPTVAAMQTTGATFQINNAKLYVPVVTLYINHNIKFLENIKQEFKRTISWNKYISEITTQTKNNNLAYPIDQHLGKSINCLLFHSKMIIMIQREILLMSITCH